MHYVLKYSEEAEEAVPLYSLTYLLIFTNLFVLPRRFEEILWEYLFLAWKTFFNVSYRVY